MPNKKVCFSMMGECETMWHAMVKENIQYISIKIYRKKCGHQQVSLGITCASILYG